MWFLLMVMLNPIPGIGAAYKLNTFDTYEGCKIERDRVGFEMAAAYPYERDFIIVCEINKRKVITA